MLADSLSTPDLTYTDLTTHLSLALFAPTQQAIQEMHDLFIRHALKASPSRR